MSDDEEWRPVPGHDGHEVSSIGRVRARSGEEVPRRVGNHRYEIVRFEGKTHLVHRLVLLSFVGQPPMPRMQGCHFDGDRMNNRLSNLRWDSNAGNFADMVRHGRARTPWVPGVVHNVGESHGLAKVTDAVVREIRLSTERNVEVARRYGLSKCHVHAIRSGRLWKHVAPRQHANYSTG